MKIAVVGTGISGMLAAHLLAEDHELTVFEAEDYAGGHTNTIRVTIDEGAFDVDTGFIVYNEWTYPHFLKLVERLGVAWHDSDMSYSVTCRRTGLEYNGTSVNTLFAQRINILRPSFHRMIREILRFNREAPALIDEDDDTLTLDEFLRAGRYSREFVEHYIVPMGSAVWSTSREKMRSFPARNFVVFFKNHGFLNVSERPTWRVITGGSQRYAERLVAPYRERIRLNTPVERVSRLGDGVEVTPRGRPAERFDHVILAAHSDQSLAMLADPSEAEREILGAIPYQENLAILHTDESVMPERRLAWASWNSLLPREDTGQVNVTYWMNKLQGLDARTNFFVTLNPCEAIDEAKILRRIVYHHPLYTPGAISAQKRRDEICGVRNTHYCGAYWSHGFHEDGVRSALAVTERFGASL